MDFFLNTMPSILLNILKKREEATHATSFLFVEHSFVIRIDAFVLNHPFPSMLRKYP